MVKFLSSRLGVPYLVTDGGEVIPASYAHADDLVAVELSEPGTLAEMQASARMGIEELVGIDAALPDVEWWATFNAFLAINEFTTPLNVIAQARNQAFRITQEDPDE